MLRETLEKLICLTRRVPRDVITDRQLTVKLEQLRENGYTSFDHLVGNPDFVNLARQVKDAFEKDMAFHTPCLAQSRISESRDADLIQRNFLMSDSELKSRGLTFGRDEAHSYCQVVEEFAPSTLTLPLPKAPQFINLWLDRKVMKVVEAYMGFSPVLKEAYIRRNFPCTYPVMNHKWHRDTNHKHHLLKAFIFFTDCDLETGAHHFVAGSVNDRRLRDKIYYDDREIEQVFPRSSGRQISSVVPAGTIMLEDTRGLHKAGIPTRDYRDLGFAVFVPPSLSILQKPMYSIAHSGYDVLHPSQKRFVPKNHIEKSEL